jgi:hypothetical protein
MMDDRHIQLAENKYLVLPSEEMSESVGRLRILTQPQWSPDGKAILFTGSYWEWADVLWFDPVVPDPTAAEMYEPDMQGAWSNGAWTRDGQKLLVSGLNYAAIGDLRLVDRTSLVTETLVSGEEAQLHVWDVIATPEGILFNASLLSADWALYRGQRTPAGFEYAPLDLSSVQCTSPSYEVTWNHAGTHAVMRCADGLRVVTFDDALSLDLTPFLSSLPQHEDWHMRWGENP